MKGGAAPFVGRRPELAYLQARYDEVSAGRLVLVVIQGPPGIGKTALVHRFAAGCSNAHVLRASGEESEKLLGYGVVDQLLRTSSTSHPAQPDRGHLEDHLTVGARVLQRVVDMEQQGQVVLIVDDLHWADDASTKALLFALRRLDTHRVLTLLVTRRDESWPLAEAWRTLSAGSGYSRLEMHGLPAHDLVEMAHWNGIHTFSDRMAQALHEHTEGSPLHVQALLSEFPTFAWGDPGSSPPAPRSFSQLVLDRLMRCSPDTRRLLAAAAVLGMRSPVGGAAALASLEDPMPALEEAVEARLVQSREDGGGGDVVSFTHPLVRAAIYQGLAAAERSGLHTRAAELAADHASSLRHRAAASTGPDSGLAADLEAFAREEGTRRAWNSAALHLVSASRVAGSAPQRERLLLDAVSWMLLNGDVSQAAVVATGISTLGPGARRDHVLGQLANLQGEHLEGEALLRSAWEQCDPVAESQLAATIAVENAVHMLGRFRAREGIEWAAISLDLLGAGDEALAPMVLSVLSLGLGYAGRPGEAVGTLAAAKASGKAAARDWELVARGLLRMIEDDHDGARADLARAATMALQRGSLLTAAAAFGWLGTAEYYLGRWDDAARHGERAVLIDLDAQRPYRAFAPSAVVAVPAARGEWAQAEEHVRAWVSNASGYESSIGAAAIAEAQLADARSEHQGVVDGLEPVLRFSYREGIDEPGFWPWQDLYGDALVSLGRLREADHFLRPHEALARERGRRSMTARLARVRGRLEAAGGRAESAEAAWRDALAQIESLRMPFEQARIQLAYGSFLRRQGRRLAAAGQLAAAQATLLGLAAEPYVERCARELAACGLNPGRRRGRDRTRLTPRELSVARLVSTGLGNREVAAELMVSVKTVEFHLGQIFDKLEIRSRRQIAPRLRTMVRL